MKVFTASNGIIFTITEDGVLKWEGGYDPHRVTAALREYFRQERDQELGRWRDPQNPNMVVYPLDDGEVRVLDERDRTALRWSRAQAEDDEYSLGFGFATAGRYFQAHPEPEPEPWEKARPYCDEIWVLTIHGCEQPVYVTEFRGEPVFQVPGGETISLSHSAITAGRRLWPEEGK